MHIERWITKATDIHLEYVDLIDFPWQNDRRTRLNITLCLQCPSFLRCGNHPTSQIYNSVLHNYVLGYNRGEFLTEQMCALVVSKDM